MRAEDYWKLFMDTGAPEIYMLYHNARKMENLHVPDDTGAGAQGHSLQ